MSSTQGSIETQEAIERFADALRQRIGTDRFRLWFTHGIEFDLEASHDESGDEVAVDADAVIVLRVSGPFAADRIAKNFTADLRAASAMALGDHGRFRMVTAAATTQPELIADAVETPSGSPQRGKVARSSGKSHDGKSNSGNLNRNEPPAHQAGKSSRGRSPARKSAGKLSSLLADSKLTRSADEIAAESDASSVGVDRRGTRSPSRAESTTAVTAPLPESLPTAGRTLDSFITGPCNEFAFSAATMAMSTPEVATPLFLHGPTGTGKSHLLAAIAEEFRRRRRMRRVILLTAEQFTNDFVGSVNSTGLPSFRRKYREVDALLIDDVHFLASKTATLREALYTLETLASAGKPLVFTANLPPADIRGLTGEVAGRMSSGLVCPLLALDAATRMNLLTRLVKTRCVLDCDPGLLAEVSESISGDARAVTGVANLIGMLQRMFRREPTIEEIRQFGGDLMRNTRSAPTLRSIERAVCDAFGLERDGLRGKAQTRRVSEPRTLAMYLARTHTGSAYTEIAQHFGRRSHTGAIAAQQKVEQWLASGKQIGGGDAAMAAADAIARVEARLRA
ncbi:DnaA/Hda family protein [Allorhodopirellula heiligendammensis]|uniref:Chromosomal replication initiator protein DnaA n=1 Tax=Allorhodopirellula heiligendammensis TaxID=2714739 RepID=A0A5C6BTE6_9BACT|nr:DnaA/Hda family protein [Allorhodopirellula heiligendammensis]TWU15112.1 Chromosomal replication initiator protein DnaA [Allorhodopirellula heiligendammensis]